MSKKPSNNDHFGSIPIAQQVKQPTSKPSKTPAPSFSRQDTPPKNRKAFWLKMILIMLALGGSLYLALSFLLIPYLIKGPIAKQIAQQLNRSVTIAQARFNPIDLKLTVSNAIVGPKRNAPDDNVDPFLSFSSLEINITAASLSKGAFICQELALKQPYIHIAQNKNSPPNIFEAADKLRSSVALFPKWLRALIPIRYSINNISITGGEVRFDDLKTGKKHMVTDLHMTFPTMANTPYQTPTIAPTFSAKINGSTVSLKEMANLPSKSDTRISIKTNDLDIVPYSSYLLPESINNASIKGLADVDIALVISREEQGKGNGLKASLEGLINLKDLSFKDKKDWAKIESMNMQGIFTIGNSSPTFTSIMINTPTINLSSPLSRWQPLFSGLTHTDKIKIINGSLTISPSTSSQDKYKLQRLNAAFDFSKKHITQANTETTGGTFIVSGISANQGRFNSQGKISLSPLTTEGKLNIEQMPVTDIPPTLRQKLNFIDSGQIKTIQTQFTVKSSKQNFPLSTKLNQINIEAQDVTIRDRGKTVALFGDWRSSNGSYDQTSHMLRLGDIKIAKSELFWLRNNDKNSAWHSLSDLLKNAKTPLRITKNSLELFGMLTVKDQQNPELPINLYNLHLNDPSETPAKVSAEALINKSAPIAVSGTYKLSPFASTLKIKAHDLSISPLSPLLKAYLPAKTKGSLDIDGNLTLPELSYTGQLKINNFKTTNVHNSIEWQQAQTQAVTIQFVPLEIATEQIEINTPQISYNHQSKDQDKQALFAKGETTVVEIGTLKLNNGKLSYKMPSSPSLTLHNIDARFSGIDLAKNSKAAFELTGRTAYNANLLLSGNIVAGLKDFQIMINGGLQGINMTKLSAQTAPFIGYKIIGGTGALTGTAIISANDLTMDNLFSVQGLNIGSPVPKETIKIKGESWRNLPFLQALLQDNNDKIEVKLPVDTQLEAFSPGKTAQNRLRGLLLKSVVSPFSLLASELNIVISDYIIFESGNEDILPAEKQKLTAIADALEKRPMLNLHIASYADSKTDRNFFKKQQETEIKRRQLRHEENLSIALSSAYGKEVIDEGVTPKKVNHKDYAATRKVTISDKELLDLARRRGRVVMEFFKDKGINVSRLKISKNELVNPNPLGRAGSRVDFSLLVD